MSYCRRGDDSDVYVYAACEPMVIICGACVLQGMPEDFVAKDQVEMWKHLRAHHIAGHKVPVEALKRLREEINGKA